MASLNDAQLRGGSDLDLGMVRDFIMRNPNFIRKDIELLTKISTENNSGNVISLETLARNRLLKETQKSKSRMSEIVQTARNNYESQIRVQEAILAVLDANDIEDLQDRLSGHVCFALAADACVIAVSQSSAHSECLDKIGGIIERLVPIEMPTVLGIMDKQKPWLYGEDANNLRSEALARIEFGKNRRIGLLAIASSDIDCFREEMGQELILFFARVIERVLTRLEAQGQI